MSNSRAARVLLAVIATVVLAVPSGMVAGYLIEGALDTGPRAGGAEDAVAQLESLVPMAGCGHFEEPVADPSFVPVTGRFGPLSGAYPSLLSTGTVITEDEARAISDAIFPTQVPSEWAYRLYVRDAGMEGDQVPERLILYLSPEPVSGNILDYTGAGGVILVQARSSGVDAEFVAQQIADTGRKHSFVELGPHRAIMYLADPVARDDLRPWHLYWSDGVRDWSLQGAVDPIALIELARTLYC